MFLFFVWGARALKASERGPTYQYIDPGPPSVNEKKQGKHGAENKEDVHETVDVRPPTVPYLPLDTSYIVCAMDTRVVSIY